MRIHGFRAIIVSSALIIAGCGAPEAASTTTAQLPLVQGGEVRASAPPTSTATATIAPPTATIAPSATTAPTSIPEPTPIPPTPTDVPTEPVRLEIPDIGLDYQPVSVGLDKNNIPIVLDHDVGWYNLSAMPGQGENVVFWAHVLRFKATPNIPAPFARVAELKPGAQIVVTTAGGKQMRYQVTQSVRVKPSEVQYILPTGKEQVTLVSCIGDKVIENGFVTKTERLVTIAEPVQ